MTTDIEIDRAGTWEAIDYSDFSIEVGVSTILVAPTATVRSQVREDIDPGDSLRIRIDGSTVFEGVTESGGRKDRNGSRTVGVEHAAASLFEESVDVDETAATDEDVLQAALDASTRGGDFTLDYDGTATSLDDDYAVDDRPVKQIFRDMMRRSSRVWWIGPAGTTIHVESVGARGTWQSIDTSDGNARVERFDSGSVDTVRNDVTVVGTGDVAVVGSASDPASIGSYGRRSETVNVEYITSQSEADSMASQLLVPSPLEQGDVLVSSEVGDVTQPLANYTIDLTDPSKDINESFLAVEKQTIEQGRATLKVGRGSGVSLEDVNRRSQSRADTTAPGSVMPEERIADDSIAEPKLQALSVSVDKIEDEAVAEAKVRQDAITETKVEDDAISTPKLQAGSITSGKIDSAAVDTIHLAADAVDAGIIEADAVGADEIAANSIVADMIDALDLETAELTVGADTDAALEFDAFAVTPDFDGVVMRPSGSGDALLGEAGNEFFNVYADSVNVDEVQPLNGDNIGQVGTSQAAFSEMHAHDFVTASPDPIESVDCGELSGVDWYDNPPEAVRRRARQLGDDDEEVPDGRDHTPVELGTMANWLLETCKAQQGVIEALEERVAALEDADGGNA